MTIEFLPGLWIGKKTLVKNSNFMQTKDISIFINLIKDLSFLDKSYEYQDCIQQNIKRYETLKFCNYLEEITLFIHKKLMNSENIFIFCENGIDKTQYIILAYLIRYGLLEKKIAINVIKTKLIESFNGNIKYNEAFKIYQKKINS